MTTTRGWASK